MFDVIIDMIWFTSIILIFVFHLSVLFLLFFFLCSLLFMQFFSFHILFPLLNYYLYLFLLFFSGCSKVNNICLNLSKSIYSQY